jgi:cell division protease FtsH
VLADFTAAIERIVAGLEKRNRLLNPFERRTVAHHEIGHALVALALPGSDTVHKVSIIPRGIGSLGYTIQRPLEDRYLMTREELQNRICVLLGGRAAEQLMLGTVSTGAADDLVKATQLARDMVMRHGMDEALGCVSYDSPHPTMMDSSSDDWRARPPVSEATQQAMDRAVHAIVTTALEQATEVLAQRRAVLERCVQALLEKETLDADALRQLTAPQP